MDFVEIFTVVLRESATAALAIFAIWELRCSYQRRLEDRRQELEQWRLQSETERQDKLMLNNTLQEVAARMAEMTEVLRTVGGK